MEGSILMEAKKINAERLIAGVDLCRFGVSETPVLLYSGISTSQDSGEGWLIGKSNNCDFRTEK